ncbi:MAG: ATP-binding protein, partial [Acetatifactor sp.]|nr:ATP-binding protein [Acetatifactor sp.]
SRVALYAEEHFLVVEVKNTCAKQQPPHEKSLLSTKPDTANHGFGLSNVRDTAKKYGGTLYTQQKDGWFTAILTIAKICLAPD